MSASRIDHVLGGGAARALAARLVPSRRPPALAGVAVTLLLVALATLAVDGLQRIAPVVSLGVVYLPAVLVVSIGWNVLQGVFCALLGAAAFNFLYLPPTGRFALADERNWVSLAALIVVALVVSAVAELARSGAREAQRRRREADLAAAMARELLLGEDTGSALRAAARHVGAALALPSASIAGAGEEGTSAGAGEVAIALRGPGGEPLAALLVPAGLPAAVEQDIRTRIAPTLAALVGLAHRRDALEAERVQTEALRRSDEIKTALLRAVSHDLRTPLTSILAAGHALGSGSLQPPERTELSESVVSEAGRLSDLVDKLLDLSRLQAGAAPPRTDWVSVEELLAGAAETSEPGSPPVHLRVDPDVPDIRADAAQLERALANLLQNARRHGGGRPVEAHARRQGDRVTIAVTDRGPGIDPADRERIFEPFYRGGRASGSVGSGLGLAIVKGFVEANGGTIALASGSGEGTTFLVSLPVSESPALAGAGR